MIFTGLNHLAFITPDLDRTIRFYRDLLEMELFAGIGHDGFRHYFFKCGDGAIAFFEYDIARPMDYGKFHGTPTDRPIGFDHVSLTVPSRQDMFALKDRLEAAGIEVTGPIDHGVMWSIYFFDPVNNLPLEATWDCMELLKAPAIEDDTPVAVAEEGAGPQPGHWPKPTRATPPGEMLARAGNGYDMRESFLRQGLARNKPDLDIALAEAAAPDKQAAE